MKYLVNTVFIDGKGYYIKNTLEEAKNVWFSFFIEVFELSDEQLDNISDDIKHNYNKLNEYLHKNYKVLYTDK